MSQEENLQPEVNTEHQILVAARKVFTRKGYAAARMEDIAKEAGINRALLHYYFRSKDRLFEMVFDENIRKFYGSFIGILTADAPIDIRIRNLVSAEIDMLLHNQDLPLFVLNEITRNPELLSTRINLLPLREFKQVFVRVITEEAAKGNIRQINPLHVLLHLMSLCVFHCVGRPMFVAISGATPEQFEAIMEERKQLIAETLIQLIKPR